ncbi:glycosyl hydrolase catalytic core-domain-containing protein [Mycena sanguinolenta]|nr:glycosyl hydrolase catalytic core-domain-containing protein [Mycena sanguinolenta]
MDSSQLIYSSNFDPAIFKLPRVNWLYVSHYHSSSQFRNTEFPFYAMQWNTDGIASLAANAKAANTLGILGFNEPDISSQANMTPEDAARCSSARYHLQYISPLSAQRFKLAATAVSPPTSLAVRCANDYIALYWYGGWIDDFTVLIDPVKKYNEPIYLTGCSCLTYAFFGASTSGTGKDVIAGLLIILGQIYIS